MRSTPSVMREETDAFPSSQPLVGVRKGQMGFTLVEIVVVIAILGIMAAIAVPMVNNFLGSSKEQAYIADRATIQASVDASFSSPGNTRVLGRRQYPMIGAGKTTGAFLQPDEDSTGSVLTDPIDGNPLGGTQGGAPKWVDNGDGIRDSEDAALNDEDDDTVAGWHVASVVREGTGYVVDSRDYFINFELLVQAGLLEKVPTSASTDNTGGSASGSYSWFVDSLGSVGSLLFFFPESDQTGYQDVYP